MEVNENNVHSEKSEVTSFSILDVSDDESELPWAMYRSLDPAYPKNDEAENEDWALGDEENIPGNRAVLSHYNFNSSHM